MACERGDPIFVTGTHRSGTTWVARMLATPGMWYLHEPFNPNKRFWKKSFQYRRADERDPKLDTFVLRLLAGKYRSLLHANWADHALMPLRAIPHRPRRVLIKDPLACLLTPYLVRHFEFRALVLFRHPCGFVSSILRLGWPTAGIVRELQRDEHLVADHLGVFDRVLRENASRDGLEAAAAMCGALNYCLWKTAHQLSLRYRLFEELCEDPIGQFRELFDDLDIPYTPETRREHRSLCFEEPGTSADHYGTHETRRNSRSMAEAWRKQLTRSQVTRVRRIWDQFGIPLYDKAELW